MAFRKELEKIVEEIVAKLGGRVSIEEIRKELNIKPEELTEKLDVYNIEELELKEKKRLK